MSSSSDWVSSSLKRSSSHAHFNGTAPESTQIKKSRIRSTGSASINTGSSVDQFMETNYLQPTQVVRNKLNTSTRKPVNPFFADEIQTEDSPSTPVREGSRNSQNPANLPVKKSAAPRPSTDAYLEMMQGPKVDLFVGVKRKKFTLPKLLVCHYSPFFDRGFNGGFMEGNSQKMDLPEDTVDDFEVLEEYILHHNISNILSVKVCGVKAATRCVNFLKYADKYGIGDLTDIIYPALRSAFKRHGKAGFVPEFIEIVFSMTKKENPLRDLMAEAAISFGGISLRDPGISKHQGRFEKQENEVDGFAEAVLRCLLKNAQHIDCPDPFRVAKSQVLYRH